MTFSIRAFVSAAAVSTGLLFGATQASAQDAQTCQPGIMAAYQGPHSAQYQTLITTLIPQAGQLIAEFDAMVDQATYAPLLAHAQSIAGSITNGRVLMTLPDGTVVLDTSRTNNTYANFLAKAINENHNSRIAILAAQEYPCGLGLESKLSSSTGLVEAYFALRAGTHLDSIGTIRISSRQ